MRRNPLILAAVFLATACVGSEAGGGFVGGAAAGSDAGAADGQPGADTDTGSATGGDAVASSSSGSAADSASSGASSSGSSSGSGSGSGSSSGSTVKAKQVDPNCLDGKYTETLPPKNTPISGLLSGYQQSEYKKFIFNVLGARYPFGKTLVQNALKVAPQDCVDTFLPASFRTSAKKVMSRIGTIVHECGHFFDIYGGGGFGKKQWAIKPGLTFKCQGARATDAKLASFGSNPSFSRSLLNADKWSSKHPPCKSLSGAKGCDSYAYIYLNGDPANGKFEGGDQGFDNLIEEVTQYVNSLANAYAFQDQKSPFAASSDRDGILNFLWFVERYLHMARTKFPKFHQFVLADKCWRELVLTLWGRAWLFLEATAGNSSLGIQHAKLKALVLDPELLAEIALLRKAHGCK